MSILFLLFFMISGREFLQRHIFPVTLTVAESLNLNDTARLYVVEADVNATPRPVYRYYLADKSLSQKDFLASIQESENYFLQASEKAKVNFTQGVLSLSTTGTVSKFTNTGSYRVGENTYYVKIALSAAPE
ncbi:hypothetical protein CYR40_14945 [Chimaeribacter arupi]|uniref:hypothetical protein n=1 Tax=Yersiniaceae TaxID=1903411 RepID=UPI0009352652|nr:MULTISPECIES: hypothetical protein [Yersiniaceae]MDV5139368.1 hypothetical protein [Chimaeribacter arupi]PLR31600.1 hypothetical protein CYR23_15820 [Chimaeribacter arupi]PLR44641.1 hypothetical protein CYR40_14945 [Chimaeribacter arupi]